MTDGKYGKYVQSLRLRTEVIYPSFRGKISDFSLVYDEKSQPDSPIWTETYHAYAPGTGVFAPSELAPVIDGKPMEEPKNVGIVPDKKIKVGKFTDKERSTFIDVYNMQLPKKLGDKFTPYGV